MEQNIYWYLWEWHLHKSNYNTWSCQIQDATWGTSELGKLKEEEREREGVGALGEGLEGPAGRGASGRPNMERNSIHTEPAPRTLLLDTQAHTLTQSVRPTRTSIYSLTHLKRKRGTQSRGGHLDSVHSDICVYIQIRIHMNVIGFSPSEWKQIENLIKWLSCAAQVWSIGVNFGPKYEISFLGKGWFG